MPNIVDRSCQQDHEQVDLSRKTAEDTFERLLEVSLEGSGRQIRPNLVGHQGDLHVLKLLKPTIDTERANQSAGLTSFDTSCT